MKILLINWMDIKNPVAGGAEVHLHEIFRRIACHEEVTLLASGFEGSEPEDIQDGIRVLRTGHRPTFNWLVPFYYRKHLARKRFDVIVEDINKVPFFSPLYTGQAPFIIIPHLFGTAIFKETDALLGSYVYLMEKPIPFVYRSSTFEVISESTRNDIIQRGIPPDHIHIVHCGIDHTTYYVDRSVKKFEKPSIIFVGRLKRYKGADILIRAMADVVREIPGAELYIAGSGDFEAHLRRLAASLGLEGNCRFEGYVNTERKVYLMRRCHVTVNPSPKEGWGLNNIEANACGTPAIASDAPGLRDSVKDGDTGLLFPYGDSKTLAQKVLLILHDEKLRERFTRNAVKWAQTFHWDTTAEKTHHLIREFVGKRSGSGIKNFR